MKTSQTQFIKQERQQMFSFAPDSSEMEIVGTVLAGERYSEPQYLRQATRYIGHEVRVIRAAGLAVSQRSLVHYLNPMHLVVLVGGLPNSRVREEAQAYLDSLTCEEESYIAAFRDRLAIVLEHERQG
jgi:hypothetical protein